MVFKPDFFVTLIVKSEPMDIDLVDAEQVKSAETIKKPIKQEAVKKELIDKKTLSNLLSAQSLVCMSDHENIRLMHILGYVASSKMFPLYFYNLRKVVHCCYLSFVGIQSRKQTCFKRD